MLKNCWNKLSKRTDDWGEIRMTIEDHLTLHPNWNLHPSNPNPDLTGLKDAYRYGEENYLDKTGQVRMEVNMVKAPVRNAPVIWATTSPSPTQIPIFDTDCEDTLNALGNCYTCNKPGHVRRDCRRKPKLKPKLRAAITEDREYNLAATTATRGAHGLGLQGTQEE